MDDQNLNLQALKHQNGNWMMANRWQQDFLGINNKANVNKYTCVHLFDKNLYNNTKLNKLIHSS